MKSFLYCLAVTCTLMLFTANVAKAQSKVSLVRRGESVQLLRNGKPFVVKGVGGNSHLELLARSGGNSIRTWSTDGLDKILDDAQRHGLTVCVGFWLGHERHGFDYQNETTVTRQLNECLAAVRKYKDHPAVLLWGIGNEMEGNGTNPAVWYAINHIARECKRIDPNHPTMTVIAELGDHKLKSIERFCPDIDIVGINSYGGASSLANRVKAAKISKPYIMTEHGPLGPWEVGKSRWGSSIEPNSTVKGKRYADGFRRNLKNTACLGSYAFLWGQKQETTATWFGMILPDGSRLAAVDAMSEAWTRTAPKNRCPSIERLTLSKTDRLKPDEMLKATLKASDPENDTLKIDWLLRRDSGVIGVGGDYQAAELTVSNAVIGSGKNVQIKIPKSGGAHRLFAYVRDNHGGAAVANVPLFIDAPVMQLKAPQAKLPYAVYADENISKVYAPSGYMGNTNAIKMALKSDENPRSGKTCLRIDYNSGSDWGGVLWQSPAQDWGGKLPGGLNLTGAKELEFWARGKKGGEVVNFVLGLIDRRAKYGDSAKAELANVKLTNEWKRYRISLEGKDLSRIKTGFGWSLGAQGDSVTFFLDDIRYVK